MPDTCESLTGLYFGGAVPVLESLANAWSCDKPATVTLRAACVHEHVKTRRYCAGHGVVNAPSGPWFCRDCAELGHDCPVTPEVVQGIAP